MSFRLRAVLSSESLSKSPKRIASLYHCPRGVECLCQRIKRLRAVEFDPSFGGTLLPPCFLQAEVLGSQPSVPKLLLLPTMAHCAPFRG